MVSDECTDPLAQVFDQLLRRIYEEIGSASAHGRLFSVARQVTVMKFDGFRYDEDGPRSDGGLSEEVIRKDFTREEAEELRQRIIASDEYAVALHTVSEISASAERSGDALDRFTDHLVNEILHDSEIDLARMVENLVRFLTDEPTLISGIAELDGIIILSESIDFSHKGNRLLLRPSTKTDAEQEINYLTPHETMFGPPSAILQMYSAGGYAEIQDLWLQSMAVLRLFGLGSIRSRQARFDLGAFSGFPGRPGAGPSPYENQRVYKYAIKPEHVEGLIVFWQKIMDVLPPSCYSSPYPDMNYVGVAFRRYGEALWGSGGYERRITDATMALEALLLPNNERSELSFRLRMRAAKLLGCVGHNPFEVKKLLGTAYSIRSLFVHGGQISGNRETKLNDDYGSVSVFVEKTVDLARKCIIVFVMINRLMGKDEFLGMLDDAMLCQKADARLQEMLEKPKAILSMCL